MPAGGDLTAIWEAEGNWARIRLTDSGIGISADDLGEIFNPFFTTKTSGAGLGLAKAYMIVEEHSGTIEFESTPGRGTACSISLPIDRRALKRTKP
jgi:signal transduction histidine kinase